MQYQPLVAHERFSLCLAGAGDIAISIDRQSLLYPEIVESVLVALSADTLCVDLSDGVTPAYAYSMRVDAVAQFVLFIFTDAGFSCALS